MEFEERLKAARKALNLTQQEVADALGVTNSTYCGYETGKRKPDVHKIKKLASILKTTADKLLDTEQYISVVSGSGSPPAGLTGEEWILVQSYRGALPEYQAVVMDILAAHQKQEEKQA